MQLKTEGEIFSKFIDAKSNLGIISIDAGEMFEAEVSITNHAIMFVRKFESVEVIVNSAPQAYYLNPRTELYIPADSKLKIKALSNSSSITILSPSRAHYKNIERNCKITKKQFDDIFTAPMIITRKKWMHEIFHRYVFERVVAKNDNNYVTKFLELEIMKEIFFNYKEQFDILRKQQFCDTYVHSKNSGIVNQAVAYIEKNLFKSPTISEIVKTVGTSESTLYRVFIKHFQKSPQTYIKDRMLHEARILLLSGDYNVSDVAYMVGYNNVSSFTYAFKKKFSSLPHQLLEDSYYCY